LRGGAGTGPVLRAQRGDAQGDAGGRLPDHRRHGPAHRRRGHRRRRPGGDHLRRQRARARRWWGELRDGADRPRRSMTAQFTGTAAYLTSPELRDAVNVAIALEKPLLIKGEPGTGKTRLAEAIAQGLGMQLLGWNIKSTSK